ncbi:hypothetical protein D3C80_1467270 [compost metagenome]
MAWLLRLCNGAGVMILMPCAKLLHLEAVREQAGLLRVSRIGHYPGLSSLRSLFSDALYGRSSLAGAWAALLAVAAPAPGRTTSHRAMLINTPPYR